MIFHRFRDFSSISSWLRTIWNPDVTYSSAVIFKASWITVHYALPPFCPAYITSRLESVSVFASPNPNNSSVGEDPLEDLGQIQQQLDQISTIGRCEYERTCSLLIQLFDENAQVCNREYERSCSLLIQLFDENVQVWVWFDGFIACYRSLSIALCAESIPRKNIPIMNPSDPLILTVMLKA